MMGKPNFGDEFKRDAVARIPERGYPVAEVSQPGGREWPTLAMLDFPGFGAILVVP